MPVITIFLIFILPATHSGRFHPRGEARLCVPPAEQHRQHPEDHVPDTGHPLPEPVRRGGKRPRRDVHPRARFHFLPRLASRLRIFDPEKVKDPNDPDYRQARLKPSPPLDTLEESLRQQEEWESAQNN